MQEDKNIKKKGFLKGMRAELKKVIWPTGRQTVRSTFVTIAFVLIISVALIVLNLLFGKLNELWINALPSSNVIINSDISDEVKDNSVEDITDVENSDEIISDEVVSGE